MRNSPTGAPAKPTTLGKVSDFEMGQSPESAFVNHDGRGVPFLQGNAEFGAVFPSNRLYCERPKKLCKPGDVLISVRAPVGALNKADRAYCIGRGLAAVRFSRMLPDYGWHMLTYWAKDLRIVAQGTTFEAVGKTELAGLHIVEPPLPEQRRIAEILDTADRAIGETEALISKLKHMKTGLMHDLLTRGLDERGHLRDPDAHPEQFKLSSLGRIPRGWETGRLEDYYAVPARNGLYKPAAFYGKGPRMIHMPQMFRGLTIDVSEAARVQVSSVELNRYGLQLGDLVFARRSLNLEGAGRCSLVSDLPEPTTFESSIIRVRLDSQRLRSAFANYFLNSERGFRIRLPFIRQVAVSGVSSEDVASLPVPCPPVQEQDSIIEILDAHDARIRAEEAYRDKLKLQKKGLMDDLLTGRVRVKTAQEVGA